MKCPKCGYVRQSKDHVFAPPTECPACGVVYSKYGVEGMMPGNGSGDFAANLKKPSPVHEDSLKQARERVERRLRKKFNPYEKDEFREQTLQRARVFVSEGIKRRQAEKERQAKEMAEQLEALENEEGSIDDLAPDLPDNDEETPDEMDATASDEPMVDADDMAAQISDGEMDDSASVPEQESSPLPAADTSMESLEDEDTNETTLAAYAQDAPDELETETSVTMNTDTDQTESEQDAIPELEPEEQDAIPEPEPEMAYEMQSPEFIDSNETLDAPIPPQQHPHTMTGTNSSLLRLLPAVAWMILIAGIVGAILSWTTLNDVQAGLNEVGAMAPNNNLPIALLLGFAYLATGVLGFAFFWVSSMINSQLKDIRRILLQSTRVD